MRFGPVRRARRRFTELATPPLWLVAGVGGVAVVLLHLTSADEAGTTVRRVAPVLAFLVAITVLAELCEAAGVFDVAAGEAAHAARGRTWLLFGLVVVLATATTVVLSLDTTAVLLTPVVLALCLRLKLAPLPFALAAVWLANTASLLLPVSNLTNLLAVDRLGLSPAAFAARMALPALAALGVTVLVLAVLFRRDLRGGYVAPPTPHPGDAVLFWTCVGAAVAFAGLLVAEVEVWVAAVACAAVAVLAFAVRRPRALLGIAVPWRLVVLTTGLFVVVDAAHRHGLGEVLARLAGTGTGFVDLLQLAAAGALSANVVNNLPAYLALEPSAAGPDVRLLALLVGVNCGPLLTVWGTLATLLWRERCEARGLTISAARFAGYGLILVPLVLVATVAALALG